MTPFPSPCRVRHLPGCILFALPAEIDLGNGAALHAAVAAAADARADELRLLVLDFTETEFMDSQGARLVSDVRHHLPRHVRLRVVAAPDGVPNRVLEVTGVRRDVPVYADLTEALAAGTYP
ncbi:STAS domain-containing protein [Streptomyces chromofuscus]|uniref:STAS domain-containing protein n=1 Tax=Streptomyces chromofuscus TaxID=42881 RepID=UPI0019A53C89|nr:STAS domain-containing protein [Streptomyces chromofuscus]GGS88553.1 anti-sigma factor antagonist [Streptomyces chromofuscus]